MKHYLIFIVLLLPSVNLCANEYDTTFSGGLDTSINNVIAGGLWQEKENYGRWRLISRNLGWEHTRSYLYLQWLITNDKVQKVEELKTIPVNDFNDFNWRHISKIEYKKEKFIIYYSNRGEEGMKKATLTPSAPGIFELKL